MSQKGRTPRIKVAELPGGKWREKVHPFYVRIAEHDKKIWKLRASSSPKDRAEAQRLSENPPPDLVEEARRLHDELERSRGPRYRAAMTVLGVEDLPPDSTVSYGHYMLWRLSWYRYGKTIKQLMEESEAGSERAGKQFLSVLRDYERWRFGKLDVEKQKLKFDVQHSVLMMAGLDLGLDKLNPEELADCFDALCACGKAHLPENLRKLRTRLMKALANAKATARPPVPGSVPETC